MTATPITISDSATTLTLTPDLSWSDEYEWKPVQQSIEYSLTGAPIIDCAAVSAGRPITLEGDASSGGWITRAQLDQLDAWQKVAGKTLTLTLRGTARTVMFRHQDGALASKPIADYSDPEPGDFYAATIRFMEIA